MVSTEGFLPDSENEQKYAQWRARLYASFETLNIIAEIERHGGTKLTPVNKYNPSQHHGACPWYLNCPDGDTPCDADEDGFLVWPTLNRELQNGGARPKHYWCRKCKRSGDIANFLEHYSKIPIRQACALLGINPNDESITYSDISRVQQHGRSGLSEDQARTLAMLTRIYPYAQQMLTHPRALAYLAARSIPLEVAQALGIGYIPLRSEMAESADIDDQWCDKILFPAQSPDGVQGFRGRTLTRWQPGMDENAHRALLGTLDIAPWQATYEDGYFNLQALHQADCPVLVEGGFDVLACQSVGIQAIPVGTSRLPSLLRVRQVILALDNDESGRAAVAWFISCLRRLGIGHRVCMPPTGAKDWSEAYRLFGAQGLSALQETLQTLQFCEDCDISNFSAKKPFREHDSHMYCTLCYPGDVAIPPIASQDLSEVAPENCADCGTHMSDDSREFFYWPVSAEMFLCFCSHCRDQQTGQPLVKSQGSNSYLTAVEQVQALAEQLEANTTYVLDLETTGLNPRKDKIITLALGTPDNVSTIDVRGFYAASETIQGQWCEALQTLLHRDDITWAGHNLKFDWSFLAVHFGVRLCKVYDTMLVEALIHNGAKGLKHNLLDASARYGIEVTKEERNWFVGLDARPDEWGAVLPPEQRAYIEQDIRVPHQLINKQHEAIARLGLGRVIDLEHEVLPAIAAMEIKGITVDTERWRAAVEKKKVRRTALEPQIKRILGEALAKKEALQQEVLFGGRTLPEINLGSSDQLLVALKALGIKVKSTQSKMLAKVKSAHEVIALLLEWKKDAKFITAFGESVLQHVDEQGRIHAQFHQLGAVSGRMTCSNPNLQQIPKPEEDIEGANLRSCFIAPSGTKLLVADLSNIELRIIADFSRDPVMLRFFDDGKDLHAETARLMFNLGPEVDTKKHQIHGKRARDIAKTINFGIAYGMGPGGLAEQLDMDRDTAMKLMDKYKQTYNVLVQHLNKASYRDVTQGYTATPSGRRRTFTEEELSKEQRYHAVNAAKNHPVQGTGADILKRALTLLYAQLPPDIAVIHAVHDELILEAPIEQVDLARKRLGDCMLRACRDFLPHVAFPPIEVAVADHWVKD